MTQLHKDAMNMMCIVNIVSIVNNASDTAPEYYASPQVRRMTQNHFAFEFGYNETTDSVKEFLPYIESRFLVLIMERLPESMVLLKRKLCWGMKDVFYVHSNVEVYEKPAVNETLVNLHKLWSPLDYSFYAHFHKVNDPVHCRARQPFSTGSCSLQ